MCCDACWSMHMIYRKWNEKLKKWLIGVWRNQTTHTLLKCSMWDRGVWAMGLSVMIAIDLGYIRVYLSLQTLLRLNLLACKFA